MFTLHPRLAADTAAIGALPLCRLLLMDDARFPWLILVPARPHLHEIFDLPADGRAQLMEEASLVARSLKALTRADKINIAALGNQVDQLHVHVIARFTADSAWPNPVWNSTEPRQAYTEKARAALTSNLLKSLNITHL